MENIDKTHIANLQNIITSLGEPLEGNSFYYHNSFITHERLDNKRKNLFWCGTQVNNGKDSEFNICEIGFNGGHSSLLLLSGNKSGRNTKYTIFDIGHHIYTKPCLEYIKGVFPNVKFQYIEGDSRVKMPQWLSNHKEVIGTYDIVHVDGGHSESCAYTDMAISFLLVKSDGLLILDDTNVPHINDCGNNYLKNSQIIEENVLPTYDDQHRIFRKL